MVVPHPTLANSSTLAMVAVGKRARQGEETQMGTNPMKKGSFHPFHPQEAMKLSVGRVQIGNFAPNAEVAKVSGARLGAAVHTQQLNMLLAKLPLSMWSSLMTMVQ